MRFFFDNNLGKNLAEGFRAFGEDIVHLTDIFPPNAADEEWLPEVGKQGWILVTRDKKIRFRPAELAAWKSNNVGGFVLVGKNLGGWKIIQQLVRNWPQMKELAANERKPFLFQIRSTGKRIERRAL